jgi:hypothetical protein
MKIFTGILLVILALAAIVAAGISFRAWNELGEAEAAFHEQKTEAMDVRKRIGEVNLKYRALMDGMSEVPDTLRMELAGEYQRRAESFRKQLYGLEGKSRETERIFRKRKHAQAAARENLNRKLKVLGGAAILLLAGIVWRARAIRS